MMTTHLEGGNVCTWQSRGRYSWQQGHIPHDGTGRWTDRQHVVLLRQGMRSSPCWLRLHDTIRLQNCRQDPALQPCRRRLVLLLGSPKQRL